MPGAGTYTVGANGDHAQIQDAVGQLVLDQGAAAFTAEQLISIREDCR